MSVTEASILYEYDTLSVSANKYKMDNQRQYWPDEIYNVAPVFI